MADENEFAIMMIAAVLSAVLLPFAAPQHVTAQESVSQVTHRFTQARPGQARGQVVRRVIIQGRTVIKVPVSPRRSVPAGYQLNSRPACLGTSKIEGAALSGTRSIDFMMDDDSRVRVTLERNCPALDFYRGFYLQPDGSAICAGRDMIRTRMGGECGIEAMERFVPR